MNAKVYYKWLVDETGVYSSNGIVYAKIFGEIDELKSLVWKIFKSEFSLFKLIIRIITLGRVYKSFFEKPYNMYKSINDFGFVYVVYGESSNINTGLINMAIRCIEFGIKDVEIDKENFWSWLHQFSNIGPYKCICKNCGEVAYFVDRIENHGNKSVPAGTSLRVYPNGKEPPMKTCPCFNCGKLAGRMDVNIIRCNCKYCIEE